MTKTRSIENLQTSVSLDLSATEFHTIGGMLVARLHHLAKKGNFVFDGGYRFAVETATEKTVLKVIAERDVFE